MFQRLAIVAVLSMGLGGCDPSIEARESPASQGEEPATSPTSLVAKVNGLSSDLAACRKELESLREKNERSDQRLSELSRELDKVQRLVADADKRASDAIALARRSAEPRDAGVDRAAVKASVAETLTTGLAQLPYLQVVSIDSVFLSAIGLEQFQGHADISIQVIKLPPAIKAEQDKMRGGATFAWRTDEESQSLRDKLVTFAVLETAKPGGRYQSRIPIAVNVDDSGEDGGLGVFVEYAEGELLDGG